MDIDKKGLEAKKIRKSVELSHKRILEIGCGSGRITKTLKRPNNFVLAIDPNSERIKEAHTNLPEVEFLVAEIFDLNPESLELFDLVVFSMSLHHIGHIFHRKVQALRKAKTLLNNGGKILVIEPSATSEVTTLVSELLPEEQILIRQAQLALAEYFPNRKFTSLRIPWGYRDRQELIRHFSAITGVKMTNEPLQNICQKLQLPEQDILIHDIVYFYLLE